MGRMFSKVKKLTITREDAFELLPSRGSNWRSGPPTHVNPEAGAG